MDCKGLPLLGVQGQRPLVGCRAKPWPSLERPMTPAVTVAVAMLAGSLRVSTPFLFVSASASA